jgi:hypothetical protein
MLWRPQALHRDLRARMRAQAPAHTACGSNQDRHLMMPSLTIDRYKTRNSPWLATGRAQGSHPSPRFAADRTAKLVRTIADARSLLHSSSPMSPDKNQCSDRPSCCLTPPPIPHSAGGTLYGAVEVKQKIHDMSFFLQPNFGSSWNRVGDFNAEGLTNPRVT